MALVGLESFKTFIGIVEAGCTGKKAERTIGLQLRDGPAALDVPRCNNHVVGTDCLMGAGKGFGIGYLLWSGGVGVSQLRCVKRSYRIHMGTHIEMIK